MELVKALALAFTIAVLVVAVCVYFLMEVMMFRLSCVLARVPRPSLARSLGVVSTILGAVFIAEGILGAAVRAAYQAGGYPLWEAGLVIFFVGLPVHMLVSAAIHARLASQSFGDGLSVWFVEKSIKLMMVLVLGGLLALVIFSRR